MHIHAHDSFFKKSHFRPLSRQKALDYAQFEIRNGLKITPAMNTNELIQVVSDALELLKRKVKIFSQEIVATAKSRVTEHALTLKAMFVCVSDHATAYEFCEYMPSVIKKTFLSKDEEDFFDSLTNFQIHMQEIKNALNFHLKDLEKHMDQAVHKHHRSISTACIGNGLCQLTWEDTTKLQEYGFDEVVILYGSQQSCTG